MCCRGRHCGAACVVVSQWLAQHFATCRCFGSLSLEEAGSSHDSIMAMEEGQTIAEAGKLDKFPYEASTAAASRWSGKPRPQGGPCRQIWRHRPDCHCNRRGKLERFFVKRSLLPLQGGVAHAVRFGIVIATGKACLKS